MQDYNNDYNSYLRPDEIQIKDLVGKVFCKPYGPPNSIVVELVDEDDIPFSEQDVQNFYLDVAFCGLKYLYGVNKKPLDLSSDEYFELDQYMRSLGVTIKKYVVTKQNERLDIDPFEYEDKDNILYVGVFIEIL